MSNLNNLSNSSDWSYFHIIIIFIKTWRNSLSCKDIFTCNQVLLLKEKVKYNENLCNYDTTFEEFPFGNSLDLNSLTIDYLN